MQIVKTGLAPEHVKRAQTKYMIFFSFYILCGAMGPLHN